MAVRTEPSSQWPVPEDRVEPRAPFTAAHSVRRSSDSRKPRLIFAPDRLTLARTHVCAGPYADGQLERARTLCLGSPAREQRRRLTTPDEAPPGRESSGQ
jgi:hypothetical protein